MQSFVVASELLSEHRNVFEAFSHVRIAGFRFEASALSGGWTVDWQVFRHVQSESTVPATKTGRERARAPNDVKRCDQIDRLKFFEAVDIV